MRHKNRLRIIVTGATGFIGRNITEHFHSSGVEVLATGRNQRVGHELQSLGVALVMEAVSHLPFGAKKPAMTRFSVGYMARSMTLSIEKAKKKLGYEPLVDNREAFERYAGWWKARSEISVT